MTRIFLYVTHLLGSGHLQRTALIARALVARGASVRLATGGRPIAHLDLSGLDAIQLPPVASADEGFRNLVDERGRPIDEAWRQARTRCLLDALRSFSPDALVIETFPFGRRQLAFEIDALIAHARARVPRPILLSSVRDILQARGADVARAMVARAREAFDAILVHGDPALVRLEESFPAAAALGERIRYTGYVAGPAAAPIESTERHEVVVSTGGGAVGERLLRAALAARPDTVLARVPWRLIAGRELPEAAFAAIQTEAGAGIVVERAHAAFRATLADAALSVSQAGYNTVMDILEARVPAVLVPYVGIGQTEQSLRAAKLAARGLACVVDEGALDGATLAAAIDAAMARGRSDSSGIDRNGADTSARLVLESVAARRP